MDSILDFVVSGAGVSGVVVSKYLKENGITFLTLEKRDGIGGLWNYTDDENITTVTKKTITTHKIDPDTDETREFLLEDLAYSQALAKFAYVEGAIPAAIDQPRGNCTGDPYFTDGYRLVMWVTSTPVDINDVEVIWWSIPSGL